MKNKNRGFTLIELLVVIIVMAVLAGIVTVFVTTQGQKARDSRRVADLSQVQKALELYYAQYGCYPASTDEVAKASNPPSNPCGTPENINIESCPTVNVWWNTSLQVLVDEEFLPSLPQDPINGNDWPGILCYAYVGENTITSMECDGKDVVGNLNRKNVEEYEYALMFSTEKLTPALPTWTYGGGTGTFEYC